MTRSGVVIFDKGKRTTSSSTTFSLVTVEAMITKTHDHITRTGLQTSFIEFSVRLLSQTRKLYGVHYKNDVIFWTVPQVAV